MSLYQKGDKSMNAMKIIETWLTANSFDGLYNTDCECSCLVGDLAPCETISSECQAGYKTACDCEGTPCNFHVVAKKP